MTAYISLIALAAVASLLVVMFVVQYRHKKQMERIRAIQELSNQNKLLNNILTTTPTPVLTREMKQFIYFMLIRNYKEILSWEPENPDYIKSEIQTLSRDRKAVKETPPLSVALAEDATNHALSNLRSLFGIVKTALSQKAVMSTDAEHIAGQVDHTMIQMTMFYYKARTEKARAAGKFREAIAVAHKLSALLESNRKKAEYQQEIIETRQLIKDLNEEWKSSSRDSQKASRPEGEEGDQLDQFVDDGIDWQKTNLYE